MDAQRARGVESGVGNILEQMKAFIRIFILLFVSSLNQAEDLSNVLEVEDINPLCKDPHFERFAGV